MAKNKNNQLRKKIIIIGIILLLVGIAFAISEAKKTQNIRQEAAGKPRPNITPQPITPKPRIYCGGTTGVVCPDGYDCSIYGYCILKKK